MVSTYEKGASLRVARGVHDQGVACEAVRTGVGNQLLKRDIEKCLTTHPKAVESEVSK